MFSLNFFYNLGFDLPLKRSMHQIYWIGLDWIELDWI